MVIDQVSGFLMRTGASFLMALLFATVAVAPAGAVSLGNGSVLAGNELFDIGTGTGILDIDIYLLNNTRARIEVDVTGAEVTQGSIDFRSVLVNDTPGDLTGVELALDGAAWTLVGTLRDPVGDPIPTFSVTDTTVSITLDPPLPSNPNPSNPDCCDFLEIGAAIEAGTDWQIDVTSLPAGGGSFFLEVQGVPEPGAGVVAALGALAALSRRAASRRS